MSDAATAGSRRGAAASHVSTTEWQSFELRMRSRRAQRCLLRAEVASEAGFADDAREALEEARYLNAPPDEIARIEDLIAARIAAASEPPPRRLSWKAIAAAAALVGAATALVSSPAVRRALEPAPAVQPRIAERPVEAPAVTVQNVLTAPLTVLGTTDAEAPSAVAREEAAAAEVDAVRGPEPLPPPDPRRETPPVNAARADTRVTAAPVEAAPVEAPAPTPARLSEPAPAAPAPAVIASLPSPPAPAPPPTILEERPVVVPEYAPVPAPAATPVRDESMDVRSILSRYEDAYSQLDPRQARAVWPSVDDKALARAFSGLASQQVSLGRCDVTVNGARARAVCTGSATWTPKVGGGARTDTRRWTFDLAKSGETWRIERAITAAAR